MFSASQIVEKSDDNAVNSLCEASLNLSHDSLCSGKIIFTKASFCAWFIL